MKREKARSGSASFGPVSRGTGTESPIAKAFRRLKRQAHRCFIAVQGTIIGPGLPIPGGGPECQGPPQPEHRKPERTAHWGACSGPRSGKGHTMFGHAGERALNEPANWKDSAIISRVSEQECLEKNVEGAEFNFGRSEGKWKPFYPQHFCHTGVGKITVWPIRSLFTLTMTSTTP